MCRVILMNGVSFDDHMIPFNTDTHYVRIDSFGGSFVDSQYSGDQSVVHESGCTYQ